ncbi:hypothetical protein [Neptunicoccus cionae]|uniref:Uncharacterized protein n=1 Tax=Neptunicoccus cionae TaxID=2035344 RepID=A0A916VMM3_9RHOB|nr:hypothetical protein [Amylibacter cionae]GGA08915.1 hypothetical protein GCM10011498_06110 [Amylibacter cionae]
MRGVSFGFLVLAILSAVCGMIWGIFMAATGDHSLSPAHAHLNLLGWVTMAIFAFYYHLVPSAAEGMLPRIHFGLAALGLIGIVPGIVMAQQGQGEGLAKIGSILTLLSMVVFLVAVVREMRQGQSQPAE